MCSAILTIKSDGIRESESRLQRECEQSLKLHVFLIALVEAFLKHSYDLLIEGFV